jgi:hypothetical protein
MSVKRTLFAFFGTFLIGVASLFVTISKPDLKNKRVISYKKKSVMKDKENLFI